MIEVRKNFLNKLYKTLFRSQIHVSFLSLFAMVSQVCLKILLSESGSGSLYFTITSTRSNGLELPQSENM